jgi:hypothetical protein
MNLAFHAGADLSIDHLLAAIPEIRPLSMTDPESVTEVTKWLENHCHLSSMHNRIVTFHPSAGISEILSK